MTIRPHLGGQRPAHAPVQQFDIDQIAAQIWAEDAATAGHTAITLRTHQTFGLCC